MLGWWIEKDLEGNCHCLRYYLHIWLEGPVKSTNNFIQGSRCPSLYLKRAPHEFKSRAFTLAKSSNMFGVVRHLKLSLPYNWLTLSNCSKTSSGMVFSVSNRYLNLIVIEPITENVTTEVVFFRLGHWPSCLKFFVLRFSGIVSRLGHYAFLRNTSHFIFISHPAIRRYILVV
jgi:hypothetical protein